MEVWMELYASVILQQVGKKQETTPPEAHGPVCLMVGVCCGKQERGLCSNHMEGDLWPAQVHLQTRTHLFLKSTFKRVFPCAVKFRGPRRMCTVPPWKHAPVDLLKPTDPQPPVGATTVLVFLAAPRTRWLPSLAGWVHCSSACRAALWFGYSQLAVSSMVD